MMEIRIISTRSMLVVVVFFLCVFFRVEIVFPPHFLVRPHASRGEIAAEEEKNTA